MTSPSTVFNFIAKNYPLLKVLHDIVRTDPILSETLIFSLCKEYDNEASLEKLLDYRIILSAGDGKYELAQALMDAISFYSNEFVLNSPESIRKYSTSFSELRLRLSSVVNKNDSVRTADDIIRETRRFLDDIEAMLHELMQHARDLKSNKDNMDYRQRFDVAASLVDEYVKPLNLMLDIGHEDSIFSIIHTISQSAFILAQHENDSNIIYKLEVLRESTFRAMDIMKRSLRVVVEELSPLIKGIQRSSNILKGCLIYLEYHQDEQLPILDIARRFVNIHTIDENFYTRATEKIVEVDKMEEDIFIEMPLGNEIIIVPANVDVSEMQSKVIENLPIDNFYNWINKQLIEDGFIQASDMFNCMSILNTGDVEYIQERVEFTFDDGILNMPMVRLHRLIEEKQ